MTTQRTTHPAKHTGTTANPIVTDCCVGRLLIPADTTRSNENIPVLLWSSERRRHERQSATATTTASSSIRGICSECPRSTAPASCNDVRLVIHEVGHRRPRRLPRGRVDINLAHKDTTRTNPSPPFPPAPLVPVFLAEAPPPPPPPAIPLPPSPPFGWLPDGLKAPTATVCPPVPPVPPRNQPYWYARPAE